MASPFASRVTDTVPLPFDPPHDITIQKLAGRHLRRAHDVHLARLFAEMRERGGAKIVKEAQDAFAAAEAGDAEAKAQITSVQADPLAKYDEYEVVRAGLKAWTYPESLTPVPVEEIDAATGQKVTVMRVPAIDDLDEQAVRFIATEIMRLTKPELFATPAEAEAGRKNG